MTRSRTGSPATDPAHAPPAPAGAVPDPVRRILEFVFFGSMSWLMWFWGAAVAMWVVAMVLVPRFGELDTSIWEFLGLGWTRWVLFAAGCVLAYSMFPTLVAQGLTRRRVAQGSAAGILVVAAVGAAIVTLVYAAEGIVFGLSDVDLVASERHLFDVPGQLWWVAVESLLVCAVYMASGWFVALGFYRWNTVVGLLLIAPGLIPVAIVEAALSSSLLPEDVDWIVVDLPVGVAVLVTVATLAVTVAITARVMRETPLRSRPR